MTHPSPADSWWGRCACLDPDLRLVLEAVDELWRREGGGKVEGTWREGRAG